MRSVTSRRQWAELIGPFALHAKTAAAPQLALQCRAVIVTCADGVGSAHLPAAMIGVDGHRSWTLVIA